jgi:hypothetical protein
MLAFSIRATFDLALQCCRRHLEHMKACARAKDLLETNGNRSSKLGEGDLNKYEE